MSASIDTNIGNILGSARAEVDSRMLDQAFLETNDFRALKDTDHFSFVVGRRGTGKTALYLNLMKVFQDDDRVFSHHLMPEEHDALALLSLLHRYGVDAYNEIRATVRVLWRTSMLITVANDLCSHWKYGASADAQWLRSYVDGKRGLLKYNELQRCTAILDQLSIDDSFVQEIPGKIATTCEVTKVEEEVRRGLEGVGARAVFLFDGLDEGWVPDPRPTAVLGGLAIAVAGFGDKQMHIHGELFIRDNIFRLMATLDRDFSRHIEGSTLRLNWTQDSLLDLIANRLRVVYGLPKVENNIRIWNRFAHKELKERRGFQRCLQHTLYRPRDLLVLLNQAALHAAREGRQGIIETDIEEKSKQISSDRLTDLLREYEGVFPGLRLIVKSFFRVQAFRTMADVRLKLDSLIQDESFRVPESSDIAVLGTSSHIIDALYSIGFLGLEDQATGTISFCHDGALSSISDVAESQRIAIHPCYWKALDTIETSISTDVVVEIYDDYKTQGISQMVDMRARRLGQLVTELPNYPEGRDGAQDFEKWVLRACQILFAGSLGNFELNPAPDGIQRRDVVATNLAERGFWRRVLNDYACRQVTFEIKNFATLKPDDFRQALSYSGKQYGRLVFIVYRSNAEGLDNKDRGWVKEMWDRHDKLIVTIPSAILIRCLKKSRNPKRLDYSERTLNKRIDTFERRYIDARHMPIRRGKSRKKKRATLSQPEKFNSS